jgi:hypothetical protein
VPELLAALLALASPQGVVLLAITGGGIALFTIVGLGGIGTRDLAKPFKYFLGAIATLITIFGCVGLLLLSYPAVSPGIKMIREDWARPTPVVESPVEPTQEATQPPRDPRSFALIASWLTYAIAAVGTVAGLIVYYIFLANRIRLSKKPIGLSYVGRNDGVQLRLQNNEKSWITLHRIEISYRNRDRHRHAGEMLADFPYDRTTTLQPGISETFPFISYHHSHFYIVGKSEERNATRSEIFALGTYDIEVTVRYFSAEKNRTDMVKNFKVIFIFREESDYKIRIKSI